MHSYGTVKEDEEDEEEKLRQRQIKHYLFFHLFFWYEYGISQMKGRKIVVGWAISCVFLAGRRSCFYRNDSRSVRCFL
jgi:hypothetical protein